jgi:hypothetical protein
VSHTKCRRNKLFGSIGFQEISGAGYQRAPGGSK